MTISANTLVPRVIALAAVGYCLWPSVTALMSHADTKPPANLPALDASLLRPKLPDLPARDPFHAKLDVVTQSTGKSSKEPSKGDGDKGNSDRTATEAKDRVNPLEGLALDATCILGDQRLAVINGRLYAASEVLPAPSTERPPLKILNVLPYKVLFEWEGKTVELTYSNNASSRVASGEPGAHGGPHGVTTAPSARKSHAHASDRSKE